MSDIFLSYNREDSDTARRFAEGLEREGFSVWWDQTLRSGEAYDEVTEAALKSAKAVVVLWSPRSVVSRWVRAEATIADRNKTLVPVMIEPCERPIMFELTQTAELGHWRGESSDKAWRAFVSDVRKFVGIEAPALAPPTTPATPATVEETLKPGQSGDAPSLAVLPFTNRSALAEDEVFAEGMVEDVISALSQGVNVRVLGSTATANLSRAAISDLAGVGRQLGVRYFLEGNVRRVGASLRVTTQLLEAATGEVLWSARFDRPLAELAELQEELVLDVASSLDVQVYGVEMRRALEKPDDMTAWEALARAQAAFRQYDNAALKRSLEWATRATTIAPDFGPAQSQLADSLAQFYMNAESEDLVLKERARRAAMRGIELSPDDPVVLMRAGAALSYVGYPEEGVRYTASAVSGAPGSGFAHFYHAAACIILNRLDEAIPQIETSERLMPGGHVNWALQFFAAVTMQARERWVDAEAASDLSAALNPTFAFAYVAKAICCLRLGRRSEALQQIETARRLGTTLESMTWFHGVFAARHAGYVERSADIRTLWAETEPSA